MSILYVLFSILIFEIKDFGCLMHSGADFYHLAIYNVMSFCLTRFPKLAV